MRNSSTGAFSADGRISDTPLFGLLAHKSLTNRLWEEASRAVAEFSSNPIQFVRGAFSGSTDLRRRKRLYVGLSLAGLIHAAFFAAVLMTAWNRAHALHTERDDDLQVVRLLPPEKDHNRLSGPGDGSNATPSGGDGGGGGGGGQNSPLPASRGLLPRFAPYQIVQINPSNIDTPSIPVNITLLGP
jgi:hypothetical protein